MRRAVLATSATVAGISLLLALKPHHGGLASASGTSGGGGAGGGAVAGSPPESSGPSKAGGGTGGRTSGGAGGRSAAHGTFTGDTVDTRYGPVQVQVTLAHGKLTGVKVLQAPSENGRDRRLTEMAVPRLTQETLAAGNARIDTVSGATYTSEGYIHSLQSALDKAHA
ncbi:FMN-binding protein [Actinomadura logoneensis]|uniref:FMN-binding protein n=1 Tax=Actinomadura logoneensis TaxID=2293572 RepID=A0A372JCX1_9ACTN|nr:FMN-binding protein [Actinomadura logoneensis]RFU37861.1 FMN-binding protein [Actinomadura logoneensis]